MEETRNCINLVLTVKKYPALYDLSCNDYHNRVVRSKMWRAVAQEVNASAAACKEKWKNLRASFSRHLRNQNTSGSKLKKPYYMADYMDFLLPYSKPRRRDEISGEETTAPQVNWNEEETASDASSNYEKPNKSNQAIPDVDKDVPRNEDHESTRNRMIGTRIKDDVEPMHRCFPNCIAISRQDTDELLDDADLLFFKSLLPDVRQMTRHEKSNFKISVLSLIDKVLSERNGTSVENDALKPALEDQQNERIDFN